MDKALFSFVGILLGLGPLVSAAAEPGVLRSAGAADTVLEEVIVSAPEPRYVARTQRDRIGRIWAPVFINGKGPFRLVLDTGASHSGITAETAARLGLVPDRAANYRVRGVTGHEVVPTVRVKSMTMGDLHIEGTRLPIITDALGGADGILGTEGLADKRIYIDFRNDFIRIFRSRGQPASPGFLTIPFTFSRGQPLTIDARMRHVPMKAIIDTGGQVTIANQATRDALFRDRLPVPVIDTIVGVTADEQQGEGYRAPPIVLGNLIEIRSPRITFGDLHIFQHWKLVNEPAILVGMDALGLVDTLIIDYVLGELHLEMGT